MKDIYRYYIEGVPFMGIDHSKSSNSSSLSLGGGIQAKVGNNWFLRKGNFTGILRLTWARLGIYTSGIITTPLHVGFGHHFQIGEKFSIQPFLSGGAVIGTDDVFYAEWILTYAVLLELKFNIRKFTIGFEYTVQPPNNDLSMTKKGQFHYIGLTVGRRFKLILD